MSKELEEKIKLLEEKEKAEKELEKLRELVSAFRSNLLQSIGTREESKYHN